MYRLLTHLCHIPSLIPTASDPYSAFTLSSTRQFGFAYSNWLCASLNYVEKIDGIEGQQSAEHNKVGDRVYICFFKYLTTLIVHCQPKLGRYRFSITISLSLDSPWSR